MGCARGKPFWNSLDRDPGDCTLKVPIVATERTIMTTSQADKIIKTGAPVTVHNNTYNETFTCLFVSRTRWNIVSDNGGVFDRGDLEVVEE